MKRKGTDFINPDLVKHLSVGMEVKNYKLMCAILGTEEFGGASKRAQMKEGRRYFDWDRQVDGRFCIADSRVFERR